MTFPALPKSAIGRNFATTKQAIGNKDKLTFNAALIAPCGINCGVCKMHLRNGNKCPGCFADRKVNGKCIKCAIKLCRTRKGGYCFDCDHFPCERLKRLDKRYREKYGMSEIANLKAIRENGIKKFIAQEEKKWISPEGILCVHDKRRYKNNLQQA